MDSVVIIQIIDLTTFIKSVTGGFWLKSQIIAGVSMFERVSDFKTIAFTNGM